MKYRFLSILLLFTICSCDQLQEVVNQMPQPGPVGNDEIVMGLRQALEFGVDKQVTKLTEEDGFFGNELVKILLPEELGKLESTLRNIGLGSLVDEGLLLLNRAAEDAVKEATPIFIDAITALTFEDVKTILTGNDSAATDYLRDRTESELYNAMEPIVRQAFEDVGADRVWTSLITKYNELPLTGTVNPDLNDYVTTEALKGVFTMIAIEEADIRNRYESRTTTLLKRVFALQD